MTTASVGCRKAAVFGGSGFVGQHLAARLSRQGVEVTVLDLLPPEQLDPRVRFLECDVRQPITERLTGIDVVYNLAAVHRTPGHEDHEYYETNIRGALNVTRWCRELEVTRLIFTSSISVYGPSERRLTEQSPPEPNSAYGRSKLIAERIQQDWARDDPDRQLLIARPAVLFGPHEQGNFTRLASALRKRRFAYPGRLDTVKACGYVEDLLVALDFMLERAASNVEIFNFAYPHPYTIQEICQAFCDVANFRSPMRVPGWFVQGLLGLLPRGDWARHRGVNAERVQKLLHSTNIEPARLVDAGFVWPTDLKAALSAWQSSGRGEGFA